MSGSAHFFELGIKNNTGMKTMTDAKPKDGGADLSTRNLLSDYIAAEKFVVGDVYLFHKTNPRCSAGSSLWGVFDRCKNGEVYLESCSTDNETFNTWCRLPDGYRYCRLSTRSELRRYIFDQTWHESRQVLGVAK